MYLSLAVNKDGTEVASNRILRRYKDSLDYLKSINRCDMGKLKSYDEWVDSTTLGPYKLPIFTGIYLPEGTIKKLTGRRLTWKDEPYRIKVREFLEEDS